VRELCSPYTYYTMVPPRSLLEHMENNSGGLERIDVVAFLAKIPTLWASEPHVLEFINAMEDAQKKAVHASLPISDNLLAAFATASLLGENSFPNDSPVWGGKQPRQQNLDGVEYDITATTSRLLA